MAKKNNYDFYCEEILSGKTQFTKLYESENVLAYYHTKPVYETHIVIIPKEHIHDLESIKNKQLNVIKEIVSVARDLSKVLDKKDKGVRLITNLGKFQSTPHLHFHLIEGERLV